MFNPSLARSKSCFFTKSKKKLTTKIRPPSSPTELFVLTPICPRSQWVPILWCQVQHRVFRGMGHVIRIVSVLRWTNLAHYLILNNKWQSLSVCDIDICSVSLKVTVVGAESPMCLLACLFVFSSKLKNWSIRVQY